jgi:uncharacterized protein (DUF1330 family)
MQMPKGYWVTTYRSIKDPDKLAAYAKLAPVALAPFGAKSQAIAAHDSPAYQAAVKVLGDGAERDVRIVEGLE